MGENLRSIENSNIVPNGFVDDQQLEPSLVFVGTDDTLAATVDSSCVACNATSTTTTDAEDQSGDTSIAEIATLEEKELDNLILEKANEIQAHHRQLNLHAEAERVCWRDLIPLLDEKQKRLTSRGKKSDKNFTAFLRANNLNPSTVRSWRRRLNKQLEIPQAHVEGAAASDEQQTQPQGEEGVQQGEHEEIKSNSELLSDHATKLMEVLRGDSLLNDALRITRAADLVEELQQAMADGKLFATSFRAPEPPQPPRIMGDPVAEPDSGTLEELRQRISRMADTDDIAEALKEYLGSLIAPLLEHHPYAPSHCVSVGITRPNKRRIHVGDWLECQGVGGRLEKLIGKPDLGRVVGEDQLYRPVIRWHVGNDWKKSYSLLPNDGTVHVLFDYQAAEQFPDAFSSYPRQPENVPRKQPQSATLASPSIAINDTAPGASGTTENNDGSISLVAVSSS